MKKLFFVFLLISSMRIYAQDDSAIKLFVYPGSINSTNSKLTDQQKNRLYQKTTQLVNQTGIAEIGYSTFLVSPKFEVVTESTSQTGTLNVYLAECELNITIERTATNSQGGGAVFNSFTKSITGSGMSQALAVNNAINNISPNDSKIVAFLSDTKAKINIYYQTHCNEVLKQAEQALALKLYPLAISLYFSVPTTAPCYEEARQRSVGVYSTYQMDQCEKKLIKLKALVAMGLNSPEDYDKIMGTIESLEPTMKCYAEAQKEIDKLEARFTEDQKKKWEFKKKQEQNDTDIEKERYKAMDKISRDYQPSSSSTIVIAH